MTRPDKIPRARASSLAAPGEERDRLRPKMGRRARLATEPSPGIARLVVRGHGRSRRAVRKIGPLPAGVGPGRHARRVVIQTHIHRMRGRGAAGAASKYLAYIQKEGAEKDGSPAVLYGPEGDLAPERFEELRVGEQHQFRFIVSPEEGGELDLHRYVRTLMGRVEREVGRSLEWAACNHHDTERPHAHVVVRGVDLRGRRVLLSRQYISHGMRWTAQELATEHLGPRLERDIRLTREREVTQERFTSLDRELQRCAVGHQVDLQEVRRRSRNDGEAKHLTDRLEHLERLKVATTAAPGTWQLAEGWEECLKKLGERGDIIKQIHRALRGGDLTRFHPVRPGQGLPDGRGGIEERELVGRVAKKGFENELKATLPYAILETPTGAAYHVRLGARQAEALATGALVTFRTRREPDVRPADRHIAEVAGAHGGVYALAGDGGAVAAKDSAAWAAPARLRELAGLGLATEQGPGRWAVPPDLLEQVATRAPEKVRYRLLVDALALSLDAQVQHRGTAWLDSVDARTLGREGFGAEVRGALERRRTFVGRELGTDPGGPQRGAEFLERDRRARGRTIQKNIGQTFREDLPVGFRGRLEIGVGRFAAVTNGKEFGLVPATDAARALAGQPVVVSRDREGRAHVTLDRARVEELARRAAGEQIARETRRTFLPTIPPDFHGWIKNAPEGARYLEISDGLRFVLVPSSPEARALIGKTVDVSRDDRGRFTGLQLDARDRGLGR